MAAFKFTTRCLGVGFSALCVATGALAEDAGPFPHLLRANHLMGMKVENIDGGRIGTLRNLAVDTRTGRIRYVIIAPGGLLASRSRLRAVPPNLVSAATAKRNVVGIGLTEEQWNRAPTIRPSEIESLGNSEHERKLVQFYRSLAPGAKAASKTSDPAEIQLASDLIGQSIVNGEGEKLGEVLDLLVVLDRDTAVLALFSPGKLLPNQERHYAVSLQTLTAQKDKLLLNADRQALQEARQLSPKNWATAQARSTTPPVFQFELAE